MSRGATLPGTGGRQRTTRPGLLRDGATTSAIINRGGDVFGAGGLQLLTRPGRDRLEETTRGGCGLAATGATAAGAGTRPM